MMRTNGRRNGSLAGFWVIAAIMISALNAGAAVKKQEKTQTKFTGFMGGMMKMFGGKAANEGVVDTVAVKGDRKFRADDTTGQIVDLNEEKVYDIDIKGKSYKVSTFGQIRQKFIDEQQKAKDEMAKMKDAPPQPTVAPDQQMEFDLNAKVTGQTKTINGFQCEEVLFTIATHLAGQKLEESGGMVTTMDMWMTPKIDALKEIADFDQRYYEKLNLPFDPAMMQQMAAAVASNPYLMQSMVKVNSEMAKLDGTPVLTTTTFETVASAEQQAQQAKQQQDAAKSSGSDIPMTTDKKALGVGIFGSLAKKAIQKKVDEKQASDASTDTPGHSTLMTATTEIVTVSSAVSDQDLAMPAGFKEKK